MDLNKKLSEDEIREIVDALTEWRENTGWDEKDGDSIWYWTPRSNDEHVKKGVTLKDLLMQIINTAAYVAADKATKHTQFEIKKALGLL